MTIIKQFKLIFPLIQSLFFICANAQDTLKIKAEVLSIDTIKYYTVYKIKTDDTSHSNITVLAPKDSSGVLVQNEYREIFVGGSYKFKLLAMSLIRGEDGHNIFLNLRRFAYGNIFSLDNVEVPFLALFISNNIYP